MQEASEARELGSMERPRPEPERARPKYLPRRPAKRRRAARGTTIEVSRVSKRQLAFERLMSPPTAHPRPGTRAECADGPRPCPFVGCRYHLYLDVNPKSGNIRLNFPDRSPGDLDESCALDLAESDATTAEAIALHMNITRERVRQIEAQALAKIEHLQLELELG